MMLKEAYKTVETLPAWGGYDPYNMNLPAFSYGEEGRYLLKFGLFGSTGNPYGDLNPSNNLASFEIVLDDSIDLKQTDVYPSHNAQSSEFYYGLTARLNLRKSWEHVGRKHHGLLQRLQHSIRS